MRKLGKKGGRASLVISARVDRRIADALEQTEARPPQIVLDWLHCDAVEKFVQGLPPEEPEPPPVVHQPVQKALAVFFAMQAAGLLILLAAHFAA